MDRVPGLGSETDHRVSPLELFFDLVFVFAFTQVTTLWLDEPSWTGLAQGLLVLAILWWVWASYAWLTNSARSDATLVTAVVLVAIAALFLAALSAPNAFGSHRRLFAVALFVVVAGFVALFAVISRNTPDLLAGVLRMAQTVVLGAALILVGAFLPAGLQPAIWAMAVAIGLFGPEVTGARGWRVHPAHFAERHALILIIAIGESFSAIGFGARSHLDAGVATASVLGLLVAASFWLAYFGVSSRRLEILLTESRGSRQIAVVREGYTYGHLPLAGGILLFAFGVEATTKDVSANLHIVPAFALCFGSALYLLTLAAIEWRTSQRASWTSLLAGALFALMIPVATSVRALVALTIVGGIWAALSAHEGLERRTSVAYSSDREP
jgi:low temperature requirement protein LtrA